MTDKIDEDAAAIYEHLLWDVAKDLPSQFSLRALGTIRRQSSSDMGEPTPLVTAKLLEEVIAHANKNSLKKIIDSFPTITEVSVTKAESSASPSGWLLDAILDPNKAEDVRFNLEEARELWVARYGSRKADRLFNWQCVRVVVGHVVNRLLKYAGRFKKIIGN